MYYKKDNARFLKVPILFSQHAHRTLTGQKLYFKRVLPLFSRPYLNCLLRSGKRQQARGNSKGIEGDLANLRRGG
jgi:hypothetical protein